MSAMTISPVPLPPDEAPAERTRQRVSYDWGSVVLGEWQRWVDTTADNLTDQEAMRICTRTRVAAKWHADHNDLRLESRRQKHGRLLDLRFSRREQ